MYLESNHDENMLLVGGYPYALKQRILGSKGHLYKHMRIFLPDIDTVPTAATGNTAQAHSFSLISTSYAEKR